MRLCTQHAAPESGIGPGAQGEATVINCVIKNIYYCNIAIVVIIVIIIAMLLLLLYDSFICLFIITICILYLLSQATSQPTKQPTLSSTLPSTSIRSTSGRADAAYRWASAREVDGSGAGPTPSAREGDGSGAGPTPSSPAPARTHMACTWAGSTMASHTNLKP